MVNVRLDFLAPESESDLSLTLALSRTLESGNRCSIFRGQVTRSFGPVFLPRYLPLASYRSPLLRRMCRLERAASRSLSRLCSDIVWGIAIRPAAPEEMGVVRRDSVRRKLQLEGNSSRVPTPEFKSCLLSEGRVLFFFLYC